MLDREEGKSLYLTMAVVVSRPNTTVGLVHDLTEKFSSAGNPNSSLPSSSLLFAVADS